MCRFRVQPGSELPLVNPLEILEMNWEFAVNTCDASCRFAVNIDGRRDRGDTVAIGEMTHPASSPGERNGNESTTLGLESQKGPRPLGC